MSRRRVCRRWPSLERLDRRCVLSASAVMEEMSDLQVEEAMMEAMVVEETTVEFKPVDPASDEGAGEWIEPEIAFFKFDVPLDETPPSEGEESDVPVRFIAFRSFDAAMETDAVDAGELVTLDADGRVWSEAIDGEFVSEDGFVPEYAYFTFMSDGFEGEIVEGEIVEGEIFSGEFVEGDPGEPVLYYFTATGGDADMVGDVDPRSFEVVPVDGELPEDLVFYTFGGERTDVLEDVDVVIENFDGIDELAVQTAIPLSWHNGLMPEDVTGDGIVTPLDGLFLLQFLHNEGPGELQGNATSGASVKIDVNDDGRLSALDIVIVVNYLVDFFTAFELAAAEESARLAPDFLPSDDALDQIWTGDDAFWEGDADPTATGAARIRWTEDGAEDDFVGDEWYFEKPDTDAGAPLDTTLNEELVDAYFDELAAA